MIESNFIFFFFMSFHGATSKFRITQWFVLDFTGRCWQPAPATFSICSPAHTVGAFMGIEGGVGSDFWITASGAGETHLSQRDGPES